MTLDDPAPQPHLRDMIYGAIDGGVTTFAIVAGVTGAGLSPFVIVALGLANVLADGFSMAAGNYAGTKAELEDAQRLRAATQARIDTDPDAARQSLRSVLARRGLHGTVLEAASTQIAQNRAAWTDMLMEGQHGLATDRGAPLRAALATFLAFLAVGLVPMLPFLLGLAQAFAVSALLTLASFFAIGAIKSRWSLTPWWRSGLETLGIGGAAAAIAYAVGTVFAV